VLDPHLLVGDVFKSLIRKEKKYELIKNLKNFLHLQVGVEK
jgi:hypothetical protein